MNPFRDSVPPADSMGSGFIFSTFIELREERRFLYTKNSGASGLEASAGGHDGRHAPEVGISAGHGAGLTGSRQRNERSQTWTTQN